MTGSTGYIGKLVVSWLSEEKIPFQESSQSPLAEVFFTLQTLFQNSIPAGSVVIHCAYDFSLNAEKTHINVVSTQNLVLFAKSKSINLILISSSSAEFPQRSKYASTKRQQESILERENFGTVLRLGILMHEDNNFFRLIRIENRLPITICFSRNSPVFYTTELESFRESLLNSLNRHVEGFRMTRCYQVTEPGLTFKDIQVNLARESAKSKIVCLNPKLVFLFLNLLRRIRPINRLYNSLKFLC